MCNDEEKMYYTGISPTPPMLVYRSSKTPWVGYAGLDGFSNLRFKYKRLRGVFDHKLNAAWDVVGPRVRDTLDADEVAWTSIDVVRFLTDGDIDGEKILGPVVIWVGVRRGSLQSEDASNSADAILAILRGFDIDDVEVEFRESVYMRSQAVGPALLPSVDSDDDITAAVRGPLTAALGLPIAPSDRPDAQGTMALYFAEGGDSNNVLGLTCRHVLFQTDDAANDKYVYASVGEPRKGVQLLGTRAFDSLIHNIKIRVGRHALYFRYNEADAEEWEKKLDNEEDTDNVAKITNRLKRIENKLNEEGKAIETFANFYVQVEEEWSEPDLRTIGFVRCSPAITFNADDEGFTEDWAAFELDGRKFEKVFEGNFIDLGMLSPLSLQAV